MVSACMMKAKTKAKCTLVASVFLSGCKGTDISFGNNFRQIATRERRVNEQKEHKLQSDTR